MRQLIVLLVLLSANFLSAGQNIADHWSFSRIEDRSGTAILDIDTSDYFHLHEDGSFIYQLAAKNQLVASGSWMLINDTLALRKPKHSKLRTIR